VPLSSGKTGLGNRGKSGGSAWGELTKGKRQELLGRVSVQGRVIVHVTYSENRLEQNGKRNKQFITEGGAGQPTGLIQRRATETGEKDPSAKKRGGTFVAISGRPGRTSNELQSNFAR